MVLTGGGANYTVESTIDSVVSLLNSTPAVTERLTASGSGTKVLQALPSMPLSGGVARASVVTAAALVALFQSVSSVAEAMTAAVMGDPTAIVQPAELFLSGGQAPASVSTVDEVVGLLNGTPEVAELIQTSGSGETVVTAGSVSLSGGGEQVNPTGTRTYGWDVHGRLAQVSLPNGQVHSYSYDYRTRRIGLQQTAAGAEPAKSTAVVFSGGLSLAEYESQATQTTIASPSQSTVRYVRGPDMGGGVGGLLYSRRAQAVKFNLSNGRGDIVAQSDTSGALTWTASYEAYGKRTKETGENLDKQRGNSKDEDPTGLLNEGFRYRDLETGVWLSRDPAGFVDGPNVYAYVKQNPWTSFDPHGLWSWSSFGKGLAVGAAFAAAVTAAVIAAPVLAGSAAIALGASAATAASAAAITSTAATTVAVTAAVISAPSVAADVASVATGNEITGSWSGGFENHGEMSDDAHSEKAGNLVGGVLGGAGTGVGMRNVRGNFRDKLARQAAKEEAAASTAEQGAVNAMISKDFKLFTGRSVYASKGGVPRNVSDKVKAEYGGLNGKGSGCAEAETLTKVDSAGVNMSGGSSAAALVGGKRSGELIPACGRCSPVLERRNINDAVK